MKRITNILSYLCLLLLLLVVACSDLEEIVVNMQGEEEVELTIQTNIPSLGGSTRTAPTENITSITALAFDGDHELIKVVTATLTNPQGTSGTLSVKVPLRTRRIHFIAKNNDVFDEITDDDYGKSDVDLLKDLLTTELHYWAMLQFDDADDLENLSDELAAEPNTDNKLTLIRNMAKVELSLPNGTSGYIAGFLNYNTEGTIAAYSGDDFQYLSAKTSTHYVPATHTSDDEDDGNADSKPSVEYMFEETNANGDYVYVICNIADKYYKIAFAYADANDETVYFPIVRNHSYTINIKEGYSTAYGKDSFESAIDADPINATAQEEVEFIFDYETIIMFIEDKTCEISVTIPEGITQLKVLPVSIFTIQSISPNLELGGDDLYTVTPRTKYTFTLKLDESHTETGKAPVRFIGEGVGKIAHKDVEVKLRKKATLIINPEEQTLINTQGSSCYVDVTIPANINNLVIEAGDAFTVTSVATLSSTPVSPNDDGSYTVETNTTYRVTLTLKDDAVGQIGEYPIHFAGTSEYWGAEGTATITLQEYVAPDLDVYEIWVNNGTWVASDEYSVEFFGYEGSFVTGGQELGNNFYDALTVNDVTYSADNHKQQAMVMGSDDSFTFTIPEGDNRWLTMLVANDGDDSDTPSIKLMQGVTEWTTSAEADATTVPAKYNFGNGEIGTAGRLIRYELEPGTYTLKGSDADYLLYYMRVSKARPEMTDVAQPLLADYNLSWSGGDYANTEGKGYLMISDDKHIVDEDNLTHTVSLNDGNSLTISGGESTFDLTVATTRVTFSSTDSNEYGSSTIYQYPETNNGSFALQTYNAGNYTLKGTINSPVYKYSAFYDKLLLDAVRYEVKSPIMPGLYTSMDGDKLTPVDGFTNLDEAWAIGFKMPMVVPAPASDLLPYDENNPKYKNYTIGLKILDWTLSTDGDARGLGVIEKSTYNYTLGTQENNNSQEMIHPREGWTYKIKWASIAGESITPKLTDEEDPDHYFTYKGTIAKEVTIPTPYTETTLNITLDFYADEDGDGINENQGNSFNNLLLKLTDQTVASKVGLKATVTGDISTYDGKTVVLTGDFPSYNASNSGWAIHWVNSRKDGDIYYYGQDQNGTGLQFTIDANKQEQTYFIEWEFVPSTNNYPGGDIGFTYKISAYADSPVKYNLSGDTQATIAFTNEPTSNGQIQVAANGSAASNSITMPLEYGAISTEEFTVDVTVPAGVTQIKIEAEDFDVRTEPTSTITTYSFAQSAEEQTKRFKFTLKANNKSDKKSTITISDNSGNATSATVTVDLSSRAADTNGTYTVWSGLMDLEWTRNYLAVNSYLPIGTKVTLNFTSSAEGGSFEMQDCNETVFRLNGVSYPENDDYIGVGAGTNNYQFTITDQTTIKDSNGNYVAISNAINGLRINGSGLVMTSIVVDYSGVTGETFGYDFENDSMDRMDSWGNSSTREIVTENESKVLKLYNPSSVNSYEAQVAFDRIFVPGNYELTYRIKGSTIGIIDQGFQYFYDPIETGPQYKDASGFPQTNVTTEWKDVTIQFTITRACNRFLLNIGQFVGNIYIDDINLEKN